MTNYISTEKTVAIKLNNEVFLGIIGNDKKVNSYLKLEKFKDIEMNSDYVYIVLVSANEETKTNEIHKLDGIPIKNEEGSNLDMSDLANSINDPTFINIGNYALNYFNNNVVYH